MPAPYYSDEHVTLYLGDCREVAEWLSADILVTDPPYGRGWKQGAEPSKNGERHDGIAGDGDTTTRDAALAAWNGRPAVVFGDLMLPPPAGNKLTMAYRKPANAGTRGAIGGFRRDLEAIYLIGSWPSGIGGQSSLFATGARSQSGSAGTPGRYGHPHAKPVDVMETLISACPPGVVADPFAGSGSTLVAARNLGRQVIGVELEEKYCEQAARRLSQMVLAGAS
jgi:DNA modification methylase